MSDIEDTGPSYVGAALRLFAIALVAYGAVRLGGEWLFSHSNAEYLAWIRAAWIKEFAICIIASTVWALWGSYREWEDDGNEGRQK